MTYSTFAGVLGWPLKHTLSPTVHNAAFRSLDLDWVYLAWPVAPDELASAVAGMRALGAAGANVTMPHKEAVIPYLDELTGDASEIGAVNTISRVGDRLVGHNTDVAGFRAFLVEDAGRDVSGGPALVLGSGGAARAVVKALDDLGSSEIVIAARREDKAAHLVGMARGGSARLVSWASATEEASRAAVVVNATPLGSDEDDPLPNVEWDERQLVVDLIYDPPTTQMIGRARAAGADAWGGLGMLVHQAAASFEIWTGREAPLEVMSAAAVRAIGQQRER